jgi:hypothetical protein
MAALAELRGFPGQELRMVAAVRIMACQAVLFNRRVLPHERSSLIRVACITEFIDSVGFNLFVAECAVDVVTA